MPTQAATRRESQDLLARLDHDSRKLLAAFYADAIDTQELKREQQRIANTRAETQEALSRLDADEQRLMKALDHCLGVVSARSHLYAYLDDVGRRELNQSVFERLYVDDDAVMGSDLTDPFRRLMSPHLDQDLASERKQTHFTPVLTRGGVHAPEVSNSRVHPASDHAIRWLGGSLALERPKGLLPWKKEEPRPSKDRGSNQSILVVLAKVNFNTARQMSKPSEHEDSSQVSTRARARLTARLRLQIVEHYQSGTVSALETAERFGVGKSTVLRILRDAGVEVRPQGRRLT